MAELLSHTNAAAVWPAANLDGPAIDAVAHMKVEPNTRLSRSIIYILLKGKEDHALIIASIHSFSEKSIDTIATNRQSMVVIEEHATFEKIIQSITI